MACSHDGQTFQLAAIRTGGLESIHARVSLVSRARTGSAGLLPHQHHVPLGLQEIITVVRTVADIQKIFSYTPARVLAFRGSADEVELSDWLIRKLDLPVTAHARAQGVEALRQESAADLYRLPAPQRDGSEDLVRVFYLSPTVSLSGINEMITTMHKRGGIQKVFGHTAPPALAVRGNPNQLARAERIIEETETAAAR